MYTDAYIYTWAGIHCVIRRKLWGTGKYEGVIIKYKYNHRKELQAELINCFTRALIILGFQSIGSAEMVLNISGFSPDLQGMSDTICVPEWNPILVSLYYFDMSSYMKHHAFSCIDMGEIGTCTLLLEIFYAHLLLKTYEKSILTISFLKFWV